MLQKAFETAVLEVQQNKTKTSRKNLIIFRDIFMEIYKRLILLPDRPLPLFWHFPK